ncbi:hypothetical protein [Pseudooctadecabacter jejudonensis]|uniref:Lipoprotein n=1 Tax=Pseudooctadecabacter jejudonensis TaxID=1391910 RepID=A0A1Y5S040_9RHOB|nr:hypothetical protein [Pseudooctadecabacter jejudonensis]SLN26599.1 hypothetical protein PSJ8397_01067 [Pseudooctadecabacter jejudonensis]
MKRIFGLLAVGVALSACAPTGNNSVFLDNGNDVSFLRTGATACPNIGTEVSPRYPMRCGPQQQVIPR